MITLVLHLLRLLPFLVGGHRQLALENLVLRQQILEQVTLRAVRVTVTAMLLVVGAALVIGLV